MVVPPLRSYLCWGNSFVQRLSKSENARAPSEWRNRTRTEGGIRNSPTGKGPENENGQPGVAVRKPELSRAVHEGRLIPPQEKQVTGAVHVSTWRSMSNFLVRNAGTLFDRTR